MDDLIRRQDAIEVANQHWYKPDIAGALAELPSVQLKPKTSDSGSVDSEQPEIKTDRTTSGDLISRQDAMDALAKFVPYVIDDVSTESYTNGLTDAYNLICQLPSAQPRNGEWIDYSDEGYIECPFCHSATNCEDNKDELHYCFSCGAELR